MSKQKNNTDNMEGKRRIRQVFPGDEEKPQKTTAAGLKAEPKHGAAQDASRVIRGISVALAMLVSLLLAMAGGVGLALWDDGRSFSELSAIVFAKEMEVAEETSAITIAEAEEPEALEDTEHEAEEEIKEEPEDEPYDTTDDYGNTIMPDEDGLDRIAKAGSDDEIEIRDTGEEPDIIDPVADYPLPFTDVDESYFTDALFIGDSRLQGFGFWSGIPATYYCATGFHVYKYETTNVVQTENGKVPIFEAMPYDAFTKVYIKVGLNELGYGTEENFEKTYAELIEKIREYEPRAIIFVHAILPVTAEKSGSDSAHNNANIAVRNEALRQFAKEQKAYFIEAAPDLSDDNGNLRPEMTSDGIHLKPEYMKLWSDYLCKHGIVPVTE